MRPDHRLRVPEPFTLVVFGASGDLTARKLIPAVFNLYCRGLLPEQTAVVGFARSPKTDRSFRDELAAAVREGLTCKGKPVDETGWPAFASRLHYHRGSYDSPADFVSLKERLGQLAEANGVPGNCLYYLGTPPALFAPVLEQLQESGLARKGRAEGPWARVVIEKPFGHDLQSAVALNGRLQAAFDEDQVFRIDHYLGKETVQNILVLRFANSIFEHLWSHDYVDHVQITVAETLGVEGRGGYYERSGALGDMLQNHVMHLVCLVAMDPPVSLQADAIRNEKVKVLQALRPIPPECAANGVVRAQYAAGTIDGRPVPGYRQEPGVAQNSTTETYVALQVLVDNWRWAGVPFYLRTGKRLARRCTEIAVHFQPVPQVLFNAGPASPLAPNILVLRIQPDEGLSLEFQVKEPGPGTVIKPLKMDFNYAASFGSAPPDAYQRLLLDAAVGDTTLFTRGDEAEAAWRFLTPVIEGCARDCPPFLPQYPAGSWGPKQAVDLIEADGKRWHVC